MHSPENRRPASPSRPNARSNDRGHASTACGCAACWAWLAADLARGNPYDARLDSGSPEFIPHAPARILDDEFPELAGLDGWRERTFGSCQGGLR